MNAGRAWAYGGVAFGAGGSVAANVGHAFVKPAGAGSDWAPQPGAIAWGVAVAVALVISVEVLARADWPDTIGWRAVRYGAGGVVGMVAAAASYRHLSDLLAHWHESELIVRGGPAIVDGLMVLCSFALMAPRPDRAAAVIESIQSTGSGASSPVADPVQSPGASEATPPVADAPGPSTPATFRGGGCGAIRQSASPPVRQSATPSATQPVSQSATRVANGASGGFAKDRDVTWLAGELADGVAWTVPELRLRKKWSEGTARRRMDAATKLLADRASDDDTEREETA